MKKEPQQSTAAKEVVWVFFLGMNAVRRQRREEK
jgi:hypothetical protein